MASDHIFWNTVRCWYFVPSPDLEAPWSGQLRGPVVQPNLPSHRPDILWVGGGYGGPWILPYPPSTPSPHLLWLNPSASQVSQDLLSSAAEAGPVGGSHSREGHATC